ncbi:hypothetical protein [Streptomyces sp. NPDC093544]|uniref:hypothetical protein n=1 Tax=Streptomyces sp. NPDC093544 TaxID=3155200 RepID=UPI003423F70C
MTLLVASAGWLRRLDPGDGYVSVYGTATRHATGFPSAILTEGAARAFGVGSLIALTALLVTVLVITGRKQPAQNGTR